MSVKKRPVFESYSILLTWPLIPARQTCAWVMFWNRHTDICLCLGPEASTVHERGWGTLIKTAQSLFGPTTRREEEQQQIYSRVGWQNPMECCFYDMHSSDGPCRKWEDTSVWCMGSRQDIRSNNMFFVDLSATLVFFKNIVKWPIDRFH